MLAHNLPQTDADDEDREQEQHGVDRAATTAQLHGVGVTEQGRTADRPAGAPAAGGHGGQARGANATAQADAEGVGGGQRGMALEVSGRGAGGKIVVTGLMGGNFSLPMVQWIYKRMTIEGFMVGTLAEGQELMALARSGKIKPTPMKEEPMVDVQKWIEELRAGKVVGRIVLKN